MIRKMSISRRQFLAATGATSILVAGAAVWRSIDSGVFESQTGPPFEAWSNWKSELGAGGALDLVRAAILAANPHNTQPWLFQVTESRIDLFADPTRNLGTIDPLRREMQIGLGCALENLLIAAPATGYGYALSILPDSENPSHIARVDLTPKAIEYSSFYDAVPNRHTDRGAFDSQRRISADILDSMQNCGDDFPDVNLKWIISEYDKQELGALIVQATEAIIADTEQSLDSSKWFRFNNREIKERRDGLTIDAMGFPWYKRAAAKFFPQLSRERSDQSWLASTRDTHVATASAFGLIQTRNAADSHQRILGGRLYQRAHLFATKQNVSMHPLSQITGRIDRETSLGIKSIFGDALMRLLNDVDRDTLMIFRVGYPMIDAIASPRRRLEEVFA